MARMGTPPGSVCRVYRECPHKWAWSHRMLLQVSLSPLSIWLQVWDSARQANLRQSPKTSQQASCSPELWCVWALACPALSSDVRTACESWTEADLRTKDVVKTGGSHLTILINGQTEPEVSCHVGHVGPADPCSTRISFKISSFEILDELYVALPKVPVRGCCDWKVRRLGLLIEDGVCLLAAQEMSARRRMMKANCSIWSSPFCDLQILIQFRMNQHINPQASLQIHASRHQTFPSTRASIESLCKTKAQCKYGLVH